METFYIKKGNKYVAVGVSYPEMLGDGIWLVQIKDYGKSYKNLACMISELPSWIRLDILTKATMLEDKILSIIRKVTNEPWKPVDLSKEIIKEITIQEHVLKGFNLRK